MLPARSLYCKLEVRKCHYNITTYPTDSACVALQKVTRNDVIQNAFAFAQQPLEKICDQILDRLVIYIALLGDQ